MRVLIIQDSLYEHMGLCYVSAVLKEAGHSVDLVVPSEFKKEKDYLQEVKNSDVVLFPCAVTAEDWFLERAKEVKEVKEIPTIFGGPHTTFYPEIIKNPQVDFIAQGESEYAVLDLVNALDKKGDTTNIPNVSTKEKTNPLRELKKELDDIPFADRDLYYNRYKFLRNLPTKRFLSGRGCPRRCSFCYVPSMKKIYKKEDGSMHGLYLRKRSVKNVIDEIKDVRSKYPMKTVRFVDDTFGWHRPWFNEFIQAYKKEINLPFTFLFVGGELDEESIRLLSESNVSSVYFGVESGVERMRNGIYHKMVTNKQIYDTARLLRKYKIKFGTYNLMGGPTETLEEAIETVEINGRIKTNYPQCTIAQPYPDTEMHEYAKKHDLLGSGKFSGMFGASTLKIENRSQIENLQKFFYVGVKFPFLMPLIKQLIKLPPNPIFKLIFLMSFAHRSIKSFNAGWWDGLKLGIKLRKSILSS